MRRLLQFESDAKFFDIFGEAFVKSFYAHNPGWDLYVADLGLTEGQRKQLQLYGTVKEYPVDPCRRWTNLTARIYSLYDIIRPNTIVMRADVDGIVCRSYEPLVQEFIDGNYGAFGMQLPYPLARRARHVVKAAELLDVPIDSPPIQDNAISAAFMILTGVPKV
ncbi:MAG TPA: hypothetical protein VLT59_15230, partial [Steroidobacteraceae bacterium]|nr:hypothetical protein [Steroidobacteraceae bacterium]